MAAATDAASSASPVRCRAPAIGGRAVLRPRLSSVRSSPRSTTRALDAELMMPLPPMNSTRRDMVSSSVVAARDDAPGRTPSLSSLRCCAARLGDACGRPSRRRLRPRAPRDRVALMSAIGFASSARTRACRRRCAPDVVASAESRRPLPRPSRPVAGRRPAFAPTAQTLRWIHDVLRRRFRRVRLCRRGDPAPPRRPSRLRGAHRHGALQRRTAARRRAAAPAHVHAPHAAADARPRRSPATTSSSSRCRTGHPVPSPPSSRPTRSSSTAAPTTDSSGQADWAAFYGGDHHGAWSYGVPELPRLSGTQRERLTGSRRIAAPGCNASTVALSFAPGIRAGVIEDRDLVSVLAVGPSGAGKSLKAHLLASEILGSANPYSVGGVHRHIPEIAQALRWAGAAGPRSRSRRSSCRCRAASSPPRRPASCPARMPRRSAPRGRTPTPASGSCSCCPRASSRARPTCWAPTPRSSASRSTRRSAASSWSTAVDNLVKGTAGAAIQSANIALGLAESTGLPVNGVAP